MNRQLFAKHCNKSRWPLPPFSTCNESNNDNNRNLRSKNNGTSTGSDSPLPFDQLVVITLGPKFAATFEELKRAGFDESIIQAWPAVRGKLLFDEHKNPVDHLVRDCLSLQTMNALKYGRQAVFEMINSGAVGCALSHLSIAYHMVEQRLDAVLVFEDDVRFNFARLQESSLSSIAELVKVLVEKAGGTSQFDCIMMHYCNQVGIRPVTSPYVDIDNVYSLQRSFGPVGWSTQGLLLTQRGARRLLARGFPLSMTIDYLYYMIADAHRDFVLLQCTPSAHSTPFTNFILTSDIGGYFNPIEWPLTFSKTLVHSLLYSLILACFLLIILVITLTVMFVRQRRRQQQKESKLSYNMSEK